MVLSCLVLRDNIKYEREHDHKNTEKQHKDKQVLDNINKHGDNETKFLNNSHIEKGLYQTGEDGNDHDNFRSDVVRVDIDLVHNRVKAHEYLENVNIIDN